MWLKLSDFSEMLKPAFLAWDTRSVTCWPMIAGELLTMKLNASFVPAGMPGPHLLASVHTSVPPGWMAQPCDFSRLTAAVTLYGNGFLVALAGVHGFGGTAGIGP